MTILNAVAWGSAFLVAGVAAYGYLERRPPTGARLLALALNAAAAGFIIWCVAPRPPAEAPAPTTEPAPCPCVERFRPGAWDCSGAVEWMPAEAREER